ncbi:MAG: hypothetical protein JNJ41_02020 [Bacteroidia bacterium]|nr:hypothetical protein [Bacteroidia bacterium]
MLSKKLTLGNVQETKQIFTRAFYARGFDVVEQLEKFPHFKLFFSNNPSELKAIGEGSSKSGVTPFFIDFKRDPDAKGYFIPESKKVCPKFDYYLLVPSFAVPIEKIDFFFEYK